MKTTVKLIGLCLILVLVGCKSAHTGKASAEEEQIALKKQLDSKDYVIEVNRVIPMGGKSVSPSTLYSLTIKGDSVFSYLPYYGRAYSVPYGGGEGMRFEALMKDYRIKYGKKGHARVTFTSQTKEDTYKFSMEIYPGGSSSIDVTSINRQRISYYGTLADPRKEKP